ncbi:hypothetical protein [Micromonospora arborensis]|uniref:hypothetical protein n=1 Tax=Micromonospora arborensis TaxID=2116518 RepID=UPI003716AF4D
MYLIQLGPVVHGRRYTLVGAMREVYGVGQAQVLRMDFTPVVTNAGSSYAVTHAPTGRVITRRIARHLRHRR